MTAPSSLIFPAMEEPFGDTMEMASPYAGHVDDFEIDIDIMEDQPLHADNDFDVQDASPADANDADMIYDVPEVAVTDTSRHDPQSDMQNGDTYHVTQETYESEMVDEEYPEDDDAPITDTEALPAKDELGAGDTSGLLDPSELAGDRQDERHGSVEDFSRVEDTEEQISNDLDIPHARDEERQLPLSTEDHPNTGDRLQNDADPTEMTVQENNEITSTKDPVELPPGQPSGKIEDTAETDRQTDRSDEAGPEGLRELKEKHDSEARDDALFLHPVKVLYQESEISMFPPREGDSSETYFLENEGLAYESIARLLKECRAILGDHASESESLVLDVDSLGIQLSEDNTNTSKVTLSQIVDLYVHLCRNEGVEQPEPLYLTLTTKLNLLAEISSLVSAADEGKGISSIQSWEDDEHERIDHVENTGSAAIAESDSYQGGEQVHLETEVPLNRGKVEQAPDNQPGGENENQHHESTANAETGVPVPNQTNLTSSESADQNKRDEINATLTEDGDNDYSNYQRVANEVHQETQYDFEDRSDSTGTLNQASSVHSKDHQQVHDDAGEPTIGDFKTDNPVPVDEATDQINHISSGDHPLVGVVSDVANADVKNQLETYGDTANEKTKNLQDDGIGESNQEHLEENTATGNDGDYGKNDNEEDYGDDYDDDDDYYDDEEGHEEEHHVENDKPAEPFVSQSEQTDKSGTAHDDSPVDATDTTSQPLDLPVANNAQDNDSRNSKGTTEAEIFPNDIVPLTSGLTDDLVGLDEDIFADSEEPVQATETGESASIGHNDLHDGNLDDLHFDEDYDFDDQGVDAEYSQLEHQETNSGKRSRALEDDGDGGDELDDNSTPDAKRSRSS